MINLLIHQSSAHPASLKKETTTFYMKVGREPRDSGDVPHGLLSGIFPQKSYWRTKCSVRQQYCQNSARIANSSYLRNSPKPRYIELISIKSTHSGLWKEMVSALIQQTKQIISTYQANTKILETVVKSNHIYLFKLQLHKPSLC